MRERFIAWTLRADKWLARFGLLTVPLRVMLALMWAVAQMADIRR